MANRRYGWHSGKLECYDITVDNDFTVNGNFTFGDAAADVFTVTGKLDANGNVDLGSGNDTINVNDHLTLASGKTLTFPSESTLGTVTLSSGAATVAASAASAGDIAILQNTTGTANAGALAAVVTAGTITITSSNASDGNTVAWMLVKVA